MSDVLEIYNADDDARHTGPVTADEARECLNRFIASHFDKAEEHARISIPANPRRDDDIRLNAYIRQSKKEIDRLAAELATKTRERDNYFESVKNLTQALQDMQNDLGKSREEKLNAIRHLNRLATWAQQDPTGPLSTGDAGNVQAWVLNEIRQALGQYGKELPHTPEVIRLQNAAERAYKRLCEIAAAPDRDTFMRRWWPEWNDELRMLMGKEPLDARAALAAPQTPAPVEGKCPCECEMNSETGFVEVVAVNHTCPIHGSSRSGKEVG